ncbi:MAG: helix-turn-helix transcriptional regulator, partial [Candidatus Eremiobacteraeota bacterium]|nr:helix-turn-helix transcriptional regulator [Candidatus Eremiobacteraeota bacterium]
MSRTPDPQRPAELLDRILEYAAQHGLAALSLRPLAKAIGTSPRVLLYYFGSKEALVAKVFSHVRAQQHTTITRLNEQTYVHPNDACRAAWKSMSQPEH